MRAREEPGLSVPGDVAVVGCDEIGALSVGMLLEHIDRRRGRSEVILKPELVVRASAPYGGKGGS